MQQCCTENQFYLFFGNRSHRCFNRCHRCKVGKPNLWERCCTFMEKRRRCTIAGITIVQLYNSNTCLVYIQCISISYGHHYFKVTMCQSIHSAVKSSVNNFVTVCAKHPRILWWRFDCDARVENVNMDVRLFSSQYSLKARRCYPSPLWG